MKEKIIDIKITHRNLVWVIATGLISCVAFDVISESMTVTTYYPAPMGIYKKLESTGDSFFASKGGNVGIGTTDPKQKLHIKGNTYINGNIGIGTQPDPVIKLKVDGSTLLDDGVILGYTDDPTPGTIRFDGTDFQGRDQKDWKSLTQGPAEVPECYDKGGSWHARQELCYFYQTSCPSGWTKKENFSSAVATGCSGRDGRWSCGGTSCGTRGHTKSNTKPATCQYQASRAKRCRGGCIPSCNWWTSTCTSRIIEVGCVKPGT